MMTGQVLVTHDNVSDKRCAMACYDHEDCWSFNYRRDSGKCELNGGLQEPVITEHTNTDLYSKTTGERERERVGVWERERVGECFHDGLECVFVRAVS